MVRKSVAYRFNIRCRVFLNPVFMNVVLTTLLFFTSSDECTTTTTPMASSFSIPVVQIGDGLTISRITAGCWQLAGGHGEIDHTMFASDMATHVANGITTFDTADIYGENGQVRNKV